MATLTIPPPGYHRAYAPTIIRVTGSTNTAKLLITNANDTSQSHEITVDLLYRDSNGAYYADINLQAYICSFFKHGEQAVPYRLTAGYDQRQYIALRSAAQLGESADMQVFCGAILTDFDVLKGYEGYPLSVNVLGESGNHYSFYYENADSEDRFTPVVDGLVTYHVIPKTEKDEEGNILLTNDYGCSAQPIWVRPTTDNVRWGSYRCQQYYIPDYTVTVISGNEELGTAWGGGTIAQGDKVFARAKPLSEDLIFDVWYYNGVRREDIPREYEFYPTEDCELVAYFKLDTKTPVYWSSYRCQEAAIV